ncbi:PKD domain-containing protein, partial [Candidatus Woesearchaeota archaeon]|nr:PKD domain-containing protein [Candidatus Woesearchaeota archaeon]
MKRGQASYTLLYIAAGIITAIVIYYGVGSILGFRQRGEEAETVLFKQQVSTDVNRLSAQLGAARNLSYLMPPQFNTICYVDTSKRQEILEKITDFVTDKKIISIINDSIYSNNTNNVFLFGAETDAYYAGKVQICKVPIKCFEAEGGRVVVEIYGGGGFALLEPCEPVINLPPIVYPLTEKNVFITLPRGQPFPEEEILAWAEDPELGDLNIDWYIMNTTGNLSEPVRTNTSDPTPVYTNYSLQTYDYGLYKATVVATDTSGKAGSTAFEFKIMISPPGNLLPFANITLPEDEEKFDVGYTVAFEGRGNDSDSEELTYEWQFGDGFVENGVSPPRSAGEEFVATTSHTYLHDGIYTVKFTVRDNESSYFDAINIIIGNSPPDVTMDFPLQNEVITYTDVTFGYTPSDRDHEKQQTLSCLIILDGERISLGDITIEPPLTVPQTFLKQGMSEGEHTWSVACS